MAGNDSRTRIAVTGIGVISPIGIGNDAFWESLVEGRSGVRTIKAFSTRELPQHFAGEIADFDAKQYVRQRKMLKVMSRDIQLAVSSAELAFADAGLKEGDYDPGRLGVDYGADLIHSTPEELGPSVGACKDEHGFDFSQWGTTGLEEMYPLWMLRHLPNMLACHIAIAHDARGPNNTITSREASSLLAIGEACRVIARGVADLMFAGGASSLVHPVRLARVSLFEHLSRRNEAPERACRPFDADRDGEVVGEGAATFILENYEHAVRRGARIYAEIVGCGAGCDGASQRNGSGGQGLVRAVRAALAEAELEPPAVGHINAHGISTPLGDRIEAAALRSAFGAAIDQVPVTAPKSYFGNLGGGSGAVELAASILALGHGRIPPTLNYERPDPECDLRIVCGEPQPARQPSALAVNRTEAGQSAAVVVRAAS